MVIIVSLRLFGVVLMHQTASEVVTSFAAYTWVAIGVMMMTGTLLFLSAALKYSGSINFRVKMAFLFLAILFQSSIVRRMSDKKVDRQPRLAKLTGAVSLVLWFEVGIAGRAIGFLG